MTFELKLFAILVYENKLGFKFKNKLRSISCSAQQNFEKLFCLFYYFLQKKDFALALIFLFIV